MGHSKHSCYGCCLCSPNMTLTEHQKTKGCIDQTDSDFDKMDSQLVLEVARTYHNICHLEHKLAKSQCLESITLVKLYKHQTKDARIWHDYAEFDLGLTQEMVTSNSNVSDFSIVCRPNTKYPCLSSLSKHDSKYLSLVMIFVHTFLMSYISSSLQGVVIHYQYCRYLVVIVMICPHMSISYLFPSMSTIPSVLSEHM